MPIAMIVAHLLGDYVFQWNSLAKWKSQAMAGVLVHGAIVTLVTLISAHYVDPSWWMWAALIGIVHTGIDVGHFQLANKSNRFRKFSPLTRFFFDQLAHFATIAAVLLTSGLLDYGKQLMALQNWFTNHPLTIVGYVFITMPSWILVEYVIHGLLNGSAPDFNQQTDKYLSILERLLITTLVLMGQIPMALMVPMPRLILDSPRVWANQQSSIYIGKLLASTAIALVVGHLLFLQYSG